MAIAQIVQPILMFVLNVSHHFLLTQTTMEHAINVTISAVETVTQVPLLYALNVLEVTWWNQMHVFLVETIVISANEMETMHSNVKNVLRASSSMLMEHARSVDQDAWSVLLLPTVKNVVRDTLKGLRKVVRDAQNIVKHVILKDAYVELQDFFILTEMF